MFPALLFILAIFMAAISLSISKKPLTIQTVIETILVSIIFFNIGVTGLLGFYGHAFMADEIAAEIGWKPGSPFQFEMAIANLSYGLLGVLSPFFRPQFWLATVIGAATLMLGCALGHYIDFIKHGNIAPYNSGPFIFLADVAIPLVYLAISLTYFVIISRNEKSH